VIREKYRDILDRKNIRWEEGKHSEDEILSADEVIKSPGVREDVPIVRKIREKGIPVISEIEFAGRYATGKKICVTGSNGKTTVTNLIFHILKKAGFNAAMTGNVGNSFAMAVAEGNYDYYVIELSSFQLTVCTPLADMPYYDITLIISTDRIQASELHRQN